MAPGAKILLVEASSASDTDLLAGRSYAAAHANVVSMSWGGGEFSGETSYDSDFSKAGVAFVASSGDSGAPIAWPAASPNVLAVGGTTLTLGASNVWSSEAGWSGSGGGPSAYEIAADVPEGRRDARPRCGPTPTSPTMPPEHRLRRLRLRPVRGDELRLAARSAAPAPGHRSGRRSWRSPTRAAP